MTDIKLNIQKDTRLSMDVDFSGICNFLLSDCVASFVVC